MSELAVSTDRTVVLEATGVAVRFGGLVALNDVSIQVSEGAIVGLLGPNGAGKSTLLGVLSGDVRAQHGRVLLEGADISTVPSQRRVRRGLARTFQHPEVYGELTVREHIVLAHRMHAAPSRVWTDSLTMRHLRADPAEEAVVARLLVDLRLSAVADRPLAGQPLGVSRLVEIARALATEPRLVLLDEPFSGLDPSESGALASVLRTVNTERGTTMILVEHDTDTVFALSERVYVLDFGTMIAEGTPQEIVENKVVRSAYLGEVAPVAAPSPQRGPRQTDTSAAPLLRVTNLEVRYGHARAVSGISFEVQPGTVTALLGSNGAGKSTIARAISGLVPIAHGTVEFNGRDITGQPAHKIQRLGLAYLPEGRGIFGSLTVAENLRIAVQSVSKAERAEAVERMVAMFPILGERRRQVAGTLSGGQQQMLALARVLAGSPAVLIADEVSLGLAPMVVDEVFAGLEQAIAHGAALIVIEQFVHRALELADQCHIVRRGGVVWSGAAADAGSAVIEHYLGSGDAVLESA
jgi:ABC-type branched-subunit amino acid transport system ATPase component